MAASRKLYREVAGVLLDAFEHATSRQEWEALTEVVDGLVTVFADDNPKFSATKFRAAVRYETFASARPRESVSDGLSAPWESGNPPALSVPTTGRLAS